MKIRVTFFHTNKSENYDDSEIGVEKMFIDVIGRDYYGNDFVEPMWTWKFNDDESLNYNPWPFEIEPPFVAVSLPPEHPNNPNNNNEHLIISLIHPITEQKLRALDEWLIDSIDSIDSIVPIIEKGKQPGGIDDLIKSSDSDKDGGGNGWGFGDLFDLPFLAIPLPNFMKKFDSYIWGAAAIVATGKAIDSNKNSSRALYGGAALLAAINYQKTRKNGKEGDK